MEKLADLLNNWLVLNKQVMLLEEAQLAELLDLERNGRARLRTMLRIYNRLSKVRSIREKKELGAIANG